jgi:hypothetical protein
VPCYPIQPVNLEASSFQIKQDFKCDAILKENSKLFQMKDQSLTQVMSKSILPKIVNKNHADNNELLQDMPQSDYNKQK